MENSSFAIIGAGLAGCECALALAGAGHKVILFEQKPEFRSGAHVSDMLCELVCSNSLRSEEETSGVGLLKKEMRALGSSFMSVAESSRVPAGKALAVDRDKFSARMTELVSGNPDIKIIHKRVESVDDPDLANFQAVVVAAGPLASVSLAASLARICGEENCYFYDAIAPIVWTHSLDMAKVFRASRYGEEIDAGDYLNCPMNRDEYEAFHAALCAGKKFMAHDMDEEKHFEGCMPIEALAAKGQRTLTFGPMKPVGLVDPATGKRPWAVLQLRAENANMETCNLVGCQTKLLRGEQERIFRMVPGLENAEFARYGSMHRNTFVNAPKCLNQDFSLARRSGIYLAGQITGVEGYVESAASGLWLGLLLAARARGRRLAPPPEETALGALLGHLRRPVKNFQPSNVTFGLMPAPEQHLKKQERKLFYSERAKQAFENWLRETAISQF